MNNRVNSKQVAAALAYLGGAYEELGKLPAGVARAETTMLSIAVSEILYLAVDEAGQRRLYDAFTASDDPAEFLYDLAGAHPGMVKFNRPERRYDHISRAVLYAAAAHDELVELPEGTATGAAWHTECAVHDLLRLAVGDSEEPALGAECVYEAWRDDIGDSIYEMFGAHEPTITFGDRR